MSYRSDAMNTACSLILSQGTHVIDESSATAVERAMEIGESAVDVSIDMTGSGNVLSKARISMMHVVAVLRHPIKETVVKLPDDSNVYALRLR